jgi:lysophospholipase L1-like esterase
MKVLRNLAINGALLLGAAGIAFAAGEVVARTLFKENNVLFPRYHTDYRYGKYALRGARPNSEFWYTSIDGSWRFTTNSRGFRSERDFPYGKPPGTVRILALGDSHTLGTEARQDHTFSAISERYLIERKQRAEVINTGVSGFSTAEELAFLENEGHKYQPDAVVVGFYANDFEDNLKAGLFALDTQGRLVEKKYEHIPGTRIQNIIYSAAPVRWLSENSYFYSLLFNGVWEYFKGLAAKAAKQAVANEYAVATADGVSKGEIDLAAALFERMQRFCADRSIRLIVVDIPSRAGPQRFAASIPPALLERLNQAGMEVIPSRALLEHYQGVAEMHVPRGQQHISELTHALIGVEIAKRVLGAAPREAQPVEPVAAR